MRHAILGPGGVGSLLGGVLARAGHPVTLLLRPDAVDGHPEQLTVHSSVLGEFSVPVGRAAVLEDAVDVVWLTTKATALPGALDAVAPECLGDGVVVPLLNGIDHVQLLRDRYGAERVIAATIRVESIRPAPGVVEHRMWHVPAGTPPLELGPGAHSEAIAAELSAAGILTRVNDNEATILWGKLGGIATAAVAGAAAGSIGAARTDPTIGPMLESAIRQFGAVAAAEGATFDAERLLNVVRTADPGTTSSLQRDLESGRPTELDALTAPAIRIGRAHGLDVSALEGLRDLASAKASLVRG